MILLLQNSIIRNIHECFSTITEEFVKLKLAFLLSINLPGPAVRLGLAAVCNFDYD